MYSDKSFVKGNSIFLKYLTYYILMPNSNINYLNGVIYLRVYIYINASSDVRIC